MYTNVNIWQVNGLEGRAGRFISAFDDPGHPQRKGIESVPEGHVPVIDCRGETRVASGGQISTSPVPEARFALDNVLLLPHLASNTHETRATMRNACKTTWRRRWRASRW
jgi:hypothetical protein